MVTVVIEERPPVSQDTHGQVTVVNGMVGKVSGGQPQAVVLRLDVVVQIVSPPPQVPQTSTWTTVWRVRE